MMRLLSSPASPFGRKVKLVVAMKGLKDQIKVETADTTKPNNRELEAANPLSKIPVLVLADGTQLFDSKVICEYLDSLAPMPVLFPATGLARFTMLTRAALADGIMEAALLQVYERRYRPADKWVPEWLDRQQAKVSLALTTLEVAPPAFGAQPDYGHVALACALGYLDLRFEGTWRATHPALVAWLAEFARVVPAFDETIFVG